jgi:hypothetical protein
MNNNFMYLDTKITETSENLSTTISSILSNIATINSRLSDLSDDFSGISTDLDSQFKDYKTKINAILSEISMIPLWRSTITLTNLSSYTAPSNGYILILPNPSAVGNLTINGVTLNLKTNSSADDNAAELISVPVRANDVITTTVSFAKAYFVPTATLTVED